MIDRNVIEQAYCFFHQKWKVYSGRSSETQRDDIEYAISSYVDAMDADLYAMLSGGDQSFLREHVSFARDIAQALNVMASLLESC